MRFINKAHKLDLNGDWQMVFYDHAIEPDPKTISAIRSSALPVYPAVVPGNFELDLHRNGLISEPYVGLNVLNLRRFETHHIWYFKTFLAETYSDKPVSELIFEGLDCYADIYINGKWVGSSDNMLVEQSFDLTGRLQPENEIVIHIKPALIEATHFRYPPNLSAFPIDYEGLFVRKAPHMFGWDIMPRLLSAGIWRDVYILFKQPTRLQEVFLQTLEIDTIRHTATLRLSFNATINNFASNTFQIHLIGQCLQHRFEVRQPIFFPAGQILFTVENPVLWWPKGRGEAHIYNISVALERGDLLVDEMKFTHGIRTARLERSSTTNSDGQGEFCFIINDKRIFIKGTNWVPLDAFHSRDKDRLEKVFSMLLDIGCNMVRCWGGNVYESDRFYELCDQHGILVWQDFAMACCVYPQDESFQRRLALEARRVIQRIRQHPSLVLWAGDNECDQAHRYYMKTDPTKNVLTRVVLPNVIREEDPLRAYLPSSPFIDNEAYRQGEKYLPENHLWGPRGYYKSDYYTNSLCHFASEIGYHGCPEPESVAKFITPPYLWPYQDNKEWGLHSTSPVLEADLFTYRVDLMARQISELFEGIPDTLEDFSFASQVSQAEALKFFIEFFRTQKWRRTGIIWWNLVDGWPQFSDAVVDYYLCRKLAYYFIKTSQQDPCLMLLEPLDRNQELVSVNDSQQDISLNYCVQDIDTGVTLTEGTAIAFSDKVTRLAKIPYTHGEKNFFIISWEIGGIHYANHYLKGKPPFSLEQYRNWLEAYHYMIHEIGEHR